MQMTPNEYEQLTKRYSRPSKLGANMLKAFLIGGAICTIGEFLIHLYTTAGADKLTAPTLASVTLVFLSALFTGLNIYDCLAKHGGAGTLVPITGFANAITSAALEFKSEGLIMGLGAKMFTVAGPVIVYGVFAGVVYGVILYIFRLF